MVLLIIMVVLAASHGSISGQLSPEITPARLMGRPVFLTPASESTTAFLDSLVHRGMVLGTVPDARRTIMDSRGRFRFGKVEPGDYWVYTQAPWPVRMLRGSRTVERVVTSRVTVVAGQRVECVLKPHGPLEVSELFLRQ